MGHVRATDLREAEHGAGYGSLWQRCDGETLETVGGNGQGLFILSPTGELSLAPGVSSRIAPVGSTATATWGSIHPAGLNSVSWWQDESCVRSFQDPIGGLAREENTPVGQLLANQKDGLCYEMSLMMGTGLVEYRYCGDELPDSRIVATVAAFCEAARLGPERHPMSAVRALVHDLEQSMHNFRSGCINIFFDHYINTDADYASVLRILQKAGARLDEFDGHVPRGYFRDLGYLSVYDYHFVIPVDAAKEGHRRILNVLIARGDCSRSGLKPTSKLSDLIRELKTRPK